jgi:RNA polymerase sigma-70 factor, ECF subfamily
MGVLLPFRRVNGVPEEMSDAALLAACALGDSAALGGLFDRYQETIYRFLLRFLSNYTNDIEDLVQATFLQAQKVANKFRGESSARVWLIGIAANLARHHVRGEQRRQTAMSAYATHPSQPNTPERAIEQRLLLDKLRVMLSELHPELRLAFILCDVEGIPGKEAARCAGVPEGTFSRRLSEARQALREIFERES